MMKVELKAVGVTVTDKMEKRVIFTLEVKSEGMVSNQPVWFDEKQFNEFTERVLSIRALMDSVVVVKAVGQ